MRAGNELILPTLQQKLRISERSGERLSEEEDKASILSIGIISEDINSLNQHRNDTESTRDIYGPRHNRAPFAKVTYLELNDKENILDSNEEFSLDLSRLTLDASSWLARSIDR